MGVAMGCIPAWRLGVHAWGKDGGRRHDGAATETQVGVIQGNNGNVYLNFAKFYTLFTTVSRGNRQFMDEVL